MALDLDSNVTREVVVCPANHPEHEAVELLAEELEQGSGLFQLDMDLGYMASPQIAPWAAQGVHIIARPWPQSGPLFTKDDFTLDFPHGTVTCPSGQIVPMVPGKDAQFPASACDACPRACAVYHSPARAWPQSDHPRGRAVPAEAPCQDEDAAGPRFLAQTHRGGACDCPSRGPPRAASPL